MSSKNKNSKNKKEVSDEDYKLENEKLLLNPEAKVIDAVFVDQFYIDFANVDFERIFAHPPQPQGEEKAMVTQDMYRFNKNGNDVEEVFTFRGPPIVSRFGISQKVNDKTGAKSYTVYATLAKDRDPKQRQFADFLDNLFKRKAQIAEEHAKKFGLKGFSASNFVETYEYPYVKYPKDEITKEEYKDRNPYFGSKLVPWFKQRTMFVGLDKKIIPWAKLMNVEMCFVGVYTCGYHKGGMGLSVPMKMKEATVLYYRKVENNSSQEKTIEEYREQYMEEYRRGLLTVEKSIESATSAGPSVEGSEDQSGENGTLGAVGSPVAKVLDLKSDAKKSSGDDSDSDSEKDPKSESSDRSSPDREKKRRVLV